MSERGKKTRRRGMPRLGAAVLALIGFAADPASLPSPSACSSTPALAYTTVGAAIGAGLLAGASSYFTYRMRGWRDAAPAVDLAVSPTGVRGSF